MNKENILDLADALEADNEFPFDMSHVSTCIIGFYNQRLLRPEDIYEFFGCQDGSEIDYTNLWMPIGWQEPRRFTKAQAVSVLRNLAETGKVEWGKFTV